MRSQAHDLIFSGIGGIILVPFLKWAGGKRWLFTEAFVSNLPRYDRYVEPFVGGGAGFFALSPRAALLADVNNELINLYQQIRDQPAAIARGIEELQRKHSHEFYYELRSSLPQDKLSRALRTLYLNRACWNGLYRLNRNGQFNVPKGTKERVILDSDDFGQAAKLLAVADLKVSDFESTLNDVGAGDLVFIDPPYTVKHNMNGFVKYNESIFTWEDQRRLQDCAMSAARRGANVIVTNADHESIRELYKSAKEMQPVHRASVLAANPNFRSRTTELLIHL